LVNSDVTVVCYSGWKQESYFLVCLIGHMNWQFNHI